MYNCNLVPEI
ncbi:hypothetical protein Zm00014a_001941 [Zea mays]|uniref:Uncharacterized protein n=1 Tax=Zea mays TaxID=4577 RepID=A0A3L6FFI3_MAIZE|nr:hypothetical protein Zm00014a_001941 [Zea mays]